MNTRVPNSRRSSSDSPDASAIPSDVSEIRRILSGPIDAADRELLIKLLSGEDFEPPRDLTPSDRHRSAYERFAKLAARLPKATGELTNPSLLAAIAEFTAVNDSSLCAAAFVNYELCIGSLVALGKGNRRAKLYAKELAAGRKSGTFLITELGGGNTHMATRTLATFDPARREFVVHTPDDGAIKSGNVGVSQLGHLGIICARLIVGGADCGVFTFATELSTPDGPLPGVRFSSHMEMPLLPLSYGLVAFDELRVPFEAWLSDGASIDESGQFHDPLGDLDARLVRTLTGAQKIWGPAAIALAAISRNAASQALHFSAKRKSMARVGREVPLLSFTTQRGVLLKAVATSYVMTCLANDAARHWGNELVRHAEASNATATMWAPWSATTNRKLALVKALTAWTAEELITQCRQHCGVAGVLEVNRFLDHLGLAQGFNDASGNNFLILLDSGRMLASGIMPGTEPRRLGRDWASVSAVIDALRAHEHRLTRKLADAVEDGDRRGLDPFDVWNPLLSTAKNAAEAYGLNLAIDAAISTTETAVTVSVRQLLRDLTALFVLDRVQRYAAPLVGGGLLDAQEFERAEQAMDRLCENLLPHVDTLISAFGYPHSIVRSPIADSSQNYATALAKKLEMPGVGR
jgi:acyl-CoA oxidase